MIFSAVLFSSSFLSSYNTSLTWDLRHRIITYMMVHWKQLSISMLLYVNICKATHIHTRRTFIWYLLSVVTISSHYYISMCVLSFMYDGSMWGIVTNCCLWWMICIIWVMTVVVHSRLLSGFLMLFIIIFIPLFL